MSDSSPRGYDRLAPWYQTIERLRFAGGLQRWRERLLDEIPPCRQVLFLGDGDGRLLKSFLDQLLNRGPTSSNLVENIRSVDFSAKMLQCQRKRIARHPLRHKVQLEHGDVLNAQWPTRQYDLIVTAFFLDCFAEPQLRRLVSQLTTALAPEGLWYVVDFTQPDRGLAKHWAGGWLAVMHAFFRWQTDLPTRRLVHADSILKSSGLEPRCFQQNRTRWITSSLYSFAEKPNASDCSRRISSE
ncbi:class I SAM-dependent methyltransferase [Roseiconus nitratireducens]|nr:class I SAM-dependent methyltransferase [Roseiconus nitratireducens]